MALVEAVFLVVVLQALAVALAVSQVRPQLLRQPLSLLWLVLAVPEGPRLMGIYVVVTTVETRLFLAQRRLVAEEEARKTWLQTLAARVAALHAITLGQAVPQVKAIRAAPEVATF